MDSHIESLQFVIQEQCKRDKAQFDELRKEINRLKTTIERQQAQYQHVFQMMCNYLQEIDQMENNA